MFFESLQAGNLKGLNFEIYCQLRRPAARRAYRFLDKRFWQRADWQFPLRTFACEKVGLSRAYDTGQLKARLQPALKELESVGVIEPATYTKERCGKWILGIQQKRCLNTATPNDAERSELELRLISRKVSRKMAKRLLHDFSREQIERNLQFFDRLMNNPNSGVRKNPPGFLVTAIRDDIAGFSQPQQNNRPAIQSHSSASPRGPEKTTDGSAERRTRIDAYWTSLDDDGRREAEKAAFKSAHSLCVQGFQRAEKAGQATLAAVCRQSILDTYLAEQLEKSARTTAA